MVSIESDVVESAMVRRIQLLVPLALAAVLCWTPATAQDVELFAEHCEDIGPRAIDVCIDSTDDSVFIVDQINGEICKLLSDGEEDGTINHPFGPATFPTFIPVMSGIAYNPVDDTLFVLNRTASSFIEIDKDTGVSTGGGISLILPPDPTRTLSGLSYDTINDTLWSRDVNGNRAVEIDTDGSVLQTIDLPEVDGVLLGNGITFVDDEGTEYLELTYGDALDCAPTQIVRIDLDGNTTGVTVDLSESEADVLGIARINDSQLYFCSVDAVYTLDADQPATLPPSFPRASSAEDAAVTLTWVNNGTGIDGAYDDIDVLRSDNGGLSYSVLETIDGAETSYTDAEPATEDGLQDQTLVYRIRSGTGVSDSYAQIEVYTGAGALVDFVPFEGNAVYDIAYNPDIEELYVTDGDASGMIYVYNTDLEYLDVISTGLSFLRGVAYNSLTETIVVTVAGSGLLERFEVTGESLGACVTPEGDELGAVTYDDVADDYLYINLDDEKVVRIDADEEFPCVLDGSCNPPQTSSVSLNLGITYVDGGGFLASTVPGAFFQIDPDTCFPATSFPLDGLGGCIDDGDINGIQTVGSFLYVALSNTNTLAKLLLLPPGETFIRGDANNDGEVGLVDVMRIANYLFADAEVPPCQDAADVNDDGRITISDAVYLALYLYLDGPDPLPPFDEEGSDPSFLDGLSCAE